MKKQVFLFKGSFIETKRLEFELNSNNINPIIVNNNQNKIIGVISQSDLLKAVIEGGDGE